MSGDGLFRASISEVDDSPEGVPVGLAVKVTEPVATSNRPARVQISLENNANSERTFSFGYSPPFSEIRSQNSDESILLLDSDMFQNEDGTYERSRSDCWRPPIQEDEEIVPPDILRGVSLAPEEQVVREALIWGDYQNNDSQCVPTGRFSFEHAYDFEQMDSFSWGFEIEVVEI